MVKWRAVAADGTTLLDSSTLSSGEYTISWEVFGDLLVCRCCSRRACGYSKCPERSSSSLLPESVDEFEASLSVVVVSLPDESSSLSDKADKAVRNDV